METISGVLKVHSTCPVTGSLDRFRHSASKVASCLLCPVKDCVHMHKEDLYKDLEDIVHQSDRSRSLSKSTQPEGVVRNKYI